MVRVLINFRHLTNRQENYVKSKKTFISINHRGKSTSQHYTLIDMSPRHAPVCEGKNFQWAELHICTLIQKLALLAVLEIWKILQVFHVTWDIFLNTTLKLSTVFN